MRRKSNSHAPTLVVACAALGLWACSGDDYARPPCRTNKGTLNVQVPVAGCPHLSSWAILPSEVDVGGTVSLYATAAAVGNETVEFTWSSDSGIVSDPHAPTTTYECTSPGEFEIEIRVVNVDAGSTACEDVGTGSVQCDPNDGGAGR
jgi:hypothetical protein